MVVKEKRGRRRYIAFNLDDSFSKETLIAKLRSLTSPDDPPYVVQCSAGWAVVRCSPDGTDAVLALLRRADPTSSSLCTSGTLRTLRGRYPELKRTRPRARRKT